MFAINHVIDAVQNAKKQFVQNCPIDKKAQETLIGFIEDQTTYTKEAFKSYSEATTQYAKAAQSALTNVVTQANLAAYQTSWTDAIKVWQRA